MLLYGRKFTEKNSSKTRNSEKKVEENCNEHEDTENVPTDNTFHLAQMNTPIYQNLLSWRNEICLQRHKMECKIVQKGTKWKNKKTKWKKYGQMCIEP